MNDKPLSNLGDGDQRAERPVRDLVETLRFMSHSMSLATAPVCKEAADEIERLRDATPSVFEWDVIENVRGDIAAGRKLMASDIKTMIRAFDRIKRTHQTAG